MIGSAQYTASSEVAINSSNSSDSERSIWNFLRVCSRT